MLKFNMLLALLSCLAACSSSSGDEAECTIAYMDDDDIHVVCHDYVYSIPRGDWGSIPGWGRLAPVDGLELRLNGYSERAEKPVTTHIKTGCPWYDEDTGDIARWLPGPPMNCNPRP